MVDVPGSDVPSPSLRETAVATPIFFCRQDLRRLAPVLALAVALPLLIPRPCLADRVILNDGRVWEGRILSRDDTSIVIQTIGGPITLRQNDIQRIEPGKLPQDIYRERADALARDDLSGHFLLGLWCEKQGLRKEAHDHLSDVIGLDPDHEGARKALGYQRHDGKWMTEAEINQARGLILYQGRWLTPEDAAAQQAEEQRRARADALAAEVQRLARRILSAKDYLQRIEAEKALWRMHDPLAHPAIAALLDSPEPDLRLASLKAIRKLDITAISGRLVRTALFDPVEEARLRAAELLVPQYNPQVRRILVQALSSEEKTVRSAAASILGAVKDPATIPALIDGLYLTYHFQSGEAAPVIGLRAHAPQGLPPARVIPLDQPPDSQDFFVINYEALDALKTMTGQDFGTSKQKWHEWWAENEDDFAVFDRNTKK